VLPGGRVFNRYQGQLDAGGRVALPGLFFLGDAVLTTNPRAGRGIATGFLQARRLLGLLAEHGTDHGSASLELDSWGTANLRPWYDDHVDLDTQLARRWAGEDVDLARPRLPSDLIVAAADVDPELRPAVGPYLAMQALPASLNAIEPRARVMYAAGWRPAAPPGPTRHELAEIVTAAADALVRA
jgi:hypothetical protein